MTMTNATYGGPAIHKTEQLNPTEIIARLIKEKPKASREVIEHMFIAEVEEDREYIKPCLKYYFWNAWNGLHPKQRARPTTIREEDRRVISETVRKIKASIVLSELIMPNGKMLAKCTGTEVAKVSKFGAAIAAVAKRKRIGEVLTEKQLLKLWVKTR